MARHLVAAAQLSPIHKVASRSSVVAWFLTLAKRSSADEEDIPLDCDLDLLPEDRSTLFVLAAARAIR